MASFTMQLSCALRKQFFAHIQIVVGLDLGRDSHENRDVNLKLQVQVEHFFRHGLLK